MRRPYLQKPARTARDRNHALFVHTDEDGLLWTGDDLQEAYEFVGDREGVGNTDIYEIRSGEHFESFDGGEVTNLRGDVFADIELEDENDDD